MDQLKPNHERAKYAINIIWVVTAIEIISIISTFFQYRLLTIIANGGEYTVETATASDLRQLFILIMNILVSIISAITFIQWFRRAYFNLHVKVNNLSYSEGWAAGCWFVPILNLYLPYQIMKKLYLETINILKEKNEYFQNTYTPTFVNVWWTVWILIRIFAFVRLFVDNNNSIDGLINITIASIISSFLSILLAIITIKVIKDYSKLEIQLFELNDKDVYEETNN